MYDRIINSTKTVPLRRRSYFYNCRRIEIVRSSCIFPPIRTVWFSYSRSFAVEIAYLVIIAEILLGLSLTLFLLPRFVIPSLAILTIIFIGLSLWGWQQGLEKGCGCFGAVLDRTPAQGYN